MLIEIPDEKLRDYLLNKDHLQNCGKAKFFLAGGFQLDDLATFAAALEAHFKSGAQRREESRFGHRLVIEGPLQVPDGRTPNVLSVWIIDKNLTSAKFVTAYPN